MLIKEKKELENWKNGKMVRFIFTSLYFQTGKMVKEDRPILPFYQIYQNILDNKISLSYNINRCNIFVLDHLSTNFVLELLFISNILHS